MAIQSKVLAPAFFNRDRQILTRYQERRIRQTFPFLSVPPELRNIVYELCIDFRGIENYFDRCYKLIDAAKSARKAHKTGAPKTYKKTPAVLLICRQIFAEAVTHVAKQEVRFDHGLLRLRHVSFVMSEHLLRNVQSIKITTKGHPMLKSKILTPSWRGYMRLIADLAEVLESGHKLKTFTIDFDDKELAFHVAHCWDDPIECDFRNQIIDTFDLLRDVRGVEKVTINGIDPTLAAQLKIRMQSTPKSFLDLPAELRNHIYELSADYGEITPRLTRMMKGWCTHKICFPYPIMTTPTSLLLNRQIHDEAHHILYIKPLSIVFPANCHMKRQNHVPDPFHFIAPGVLQKVTHLTIRVESWEWVFAVEKILGVLAQKHALQSFRFDFRDNLKGSFQSPSKCYPDKSLATCLSDLVEIRDVKEVVFEGDLPLVYTLPMAMRMQSPKGALHLPKVAALRGDGEVVDVEYHDLV